jgi:hypothetical protein
MMLLTIVQKKVQLTLAVAQAMFDMGAVAWELALL